MMQPIQFYLKIKDFCKEKLNKQCNTQTFCVILFAAPYQLSIFLVEGEKGTQRLEGRVLRSFIRELEMAPKFDAVFHLPFFSLLLK